MSKIGSDFSVRLLSGLAIGPIVLFIAWFGGIPYLAMILVGSILMFVEWTHIIGLSKNLKRDLAQIFLICCIGLFTFFDLIIGVALCFGLSLLSISVAPGYSGRRIWMLIGVMYVSTATIALLLLRGGEFGLSLIFGLFIVVWATDIGAYFCGRLIGGPKLWKKISPKKTWSGSLGGLFCGVLCPVLVAWASGFQMLVEIAVYTLVISFMAQVGDLAESGVKRNFDVKDSGKIIPGHGGILDRIDGLVAAAIFVLIFGLIVGDGGDPTLFIDFSTP